MPKVILEFNLPEENMEHKLTISGQAFAATLYDIRQEVFRPARKHGYPTHDLQRLMAKLGEDGETLVELLEKQFSEICERNGVLDYT